MNRARLILAIAVSTLLQIIATPPLCGASDKPNVVIILADDLGWGAVGYHSDWAQTPNIDLLAKSGIELDRFYVAPMCTPTRAGLLTGRYPIRFGLARAVIPPQRNFGLATDERTLADALGYAGYKNRGIFGKWHLGHHHKKWHPLSRGFTHFEGHYNGAIDYFDQTRENELDWHVGFKPTKRSGYATDLITQAACDFIKVSASDDAPYFCYIPFNAPHSPFQAEEADLERFSNGQRQDKVKKNATILKAMIWRMDLGIGKILEAIEATGEADNTQVWFISDNGGVGKFEENNHPLKGSKLTTFEGGIRVPAIVRWPAKWSGGRKVDNTMGYIDVLPTIVASAGAEPDADLIGKQQLDGIDLNGLLAGKQLETPNRDWFSYHGQSGADRETIAITNSKWKLVIIGPDIRTGKLTDQHQVHLFRWPTDLLEKNNLANKPEFQPVIETLFQKLVDYRKLQPKNSIPAYRQGKKGFKPWTNWDIGLAPQGENN